MAGGILVTGIRARSGQCGLRDGPYSRKKKKRKKFEMGLKMRSDFNLSHCHHRCNYSPKVRKSTEDKD